MKAEDIARQIEKAIKESGRLSPWSKIEVNLERDCVSVRDFGSWTNPPDAEDDEEDYDWQVPTKDTEREMDFLCRKMESLFPRWNVSFTVQEKNWVDFEFQEKELEMER